MRYLDKFKKFELLFFYKKNSLNQSAVDVVAQLAVKGPF